MTKFFRVFGFIILMSLNSNLYAWDPASLATPKGIATVSAVFGASSGISNFLWAFRWNKHASLSDETSALIQEIGGLTAAIESWVLGLVIPIIVYQYNKKSSSAFQGVSIAASAVPNSLENFL